MFRESNVEIRSISDARIIEKIHMSLIDFDLLIRSLDMDAMNAMMSRQTFFL